MIGPTSLFRAAAAKIGSTFGSKIGEGFLGAAIVTAAKPLLAPLSTAVGRFIAGSGFAAAAEFAWMQQPAMDFSGEALEVVAELAIIAAAGLAFMGIKPAIAWGHDQMQQAAIPLRAMAVAGALMASAIIPGLNEQPLPHFDPVAAYRPA